MEESMKMKQNFISVGAVSICLLFLGSRWSWGGVESKVDPKAANKIVVPSDNPITEAKMRLGKLLFFDGRISKDGTISCNSCHDVNKSGTDNLPVSVGVGGLKGNRNSPTVFNGAFNSSQFWDARSPSLEDQAKGPMINPVEMAMPNHEAVVDRIKKVPGYVTAFKKVFGGTDPVNIENTAKAIATYERTLALANSSYDQYLAGNKKALGPGAIRGLEKVNRFGCVSCHAGPNFAGLKSETGELILQKFPLIPVLEYERKYGFSVDQGRFEVTHQDLDKNMWRVPSWRNVAITAPYFHNGSVDNLSEAVRIMAKTQVNRTLSDEDVADVVEFLTSLTSKVPKQGTPKLPEG
jgi:cytochrome c peroxidase